MWHFGHEMRKMMSGLLWCVSTLVKMLVIGSLVDFRLIRNVLRVSLG